MEVCLTVKSNVCSGAGREVVKKIMLNSTEHKISTAHDN